MTRVFWRSLACLLIAMNAPPVLAQQDTGPAKASLAEDNAAILASRAEDIGKVFVGEIGYSEVFTDAFVNAVPKAQFDAIAAQLRSQIGDYAGLHDLAPSGPGAASVRFQFGNMLANTLLQLEPAAPYKVAGFQITGTSPLLEEGQIISDRIAQLPGTTNLLFARLDGSKTVEAHNADAPLAVASAFKLWVLSALVREIEAGKREWDDVMMMEAYSVPSGGMQNWPYRSPVTLHTLATMMISVSDNTATDELIGLLGRDKIEAELVLTGHSDPARNRPFLSVREFILLKHFENEGRWNYETLDEAGRRAALGQLSHEVVGDDMIAQLFGANRPQHIDIEWFASPRDLARVMERLDQNIEARKILTVNKGFPPGTADSWSYIGFKGGSEPGVLNFTWLLKNFSDERYILTMSWNDPASSVSEDRLMGYAQQIMADNKQTIYAQVPAN